MAQQAEHTLSQALAAFDFGGPAQGALRFGEATSTIPSWWTRARGASSSSG